MMQTFFRLLNARLSANLSLLLLNDSGLIRRHYDREAFLASPSMAMALVYAASCIDSLDTKALADLALYKNVSPPIQIPTKCLN